jgi:hypothetical protein
VTQDVAELMINEGAAALDIVLIDDAMRDAVVKRALARSMSTK